MLANFFLGFEELYQNQKSKQEEAVELYFKLEKKYAPIFANQKKQACNLLFDEGSWLIIHFPSEIKRFHHS